MHIVKFGISRIVKFGANALKPFFYLFHYAFPRKRFQIPETAPPRRRARGDQAIPRIVWITNYTDRVTLPVYVNYLFNRWMAPDYTFRYASDAAREAFIAEAYPPDILASYRRLKIGAARADYWRALVLYRHGGVYMDIDAHLANPIAGLIGPDQPELFIRLRDGRITNYFMATVPGNPRLKAVIEQVTRNIAQPPDNNVFNITGPQVYDALMRGSDVILGEARLVCHQGGFTNEFFQYVDKPTGKWHREQQTRKVVED